MIKKIFHALMWVIVGTYLFMKLFVNPDAFTSSIFHLISYTVIALYAIYTGYSKKELHVQIIGLLLLVMAAADFWL